MPDITMCMNANKCPRKRQCYRYVAIPNQMQSYANFYAEECKCDNFIQATNYDLELYQRERTVTFNQKHFDRRRSKDVTRWSAEELLICPFFYSASQLPCTKCPLFETTGCIQIVAEEIRRRYMELVNEQKRLDDDGK